MHTFFSLLVNHHDSKFSVSDPLHFNADPDPIRGSASGITDPDQTPDYYSRIILNKISDFLNKNQGGSRSRVFLAPCSRSRLKKTRSRSQSRSR